MPRKQEGKFIRFRGATSLITDALTEAGFHQSHATDFKAPFSGTLKVFLDNPRDVPAFLRYLPTQFQKLDQAW